MNNYDDIINIKNHEPKFHVRMSREQRAAQFAPFQALTGLENEVLEVARTTSKRIELTDEEKEGINKKFKKRVEQITFSGENAVKSGQEVMYITERAVFVLKEDGIHLVEAAPGIDIERDILSLMEFRPIIDENIKDMDKWLFL